MGLPPYNGGLFHDGPGSLLPRLTLPDGVLVPLVDAMSRQGSDGLTPRWINYRDLSVQHLGGIYERLLERDPIPDGQGRLTLRPNPFARKTCFLHNLIAHYSMKVLACAAGGCGT